MLHMVDLFGLKQDLKDFRRCQVGESAARSVFSSAVTSHLPRLGGFRARMQDAASTI